jgi:transcriptional regulator with XRE-family HTH domain
VKKELFVLLKNDPGWLAYGDTIRKHIVSTLAGGVSRREMSEALGVTRQAICSYEKGRTVPKPHIIEKLLKKWPTQLEYRGASFGAEAYESQPIASSMPMQQSLFETLKQLKQEDLRVEVVSVSKRTLRLAVEIKIAS